MIFKNNGLKNIWDFVSVRFDLIGDSAPQDEVVENIRKGVEFKGTNLWVLIFAIFIASLGLNVNSTAVIIGAMLISPLMGPIIGCGLAVGINDFELLKNALRNFLLMIVVGIVTSTLYFFISPISTAQSELLARTTPTTYDVLIAFFGGLAGMVAQTRKERTYVVVAGVAIATALMPPLCTAGYGLATGQLRYFFGAFYLFFINTVFIAIATYLMVLFLHYNKKVFLDKNREKKVRNSMIFIAIIALVPSVILGFRIVNRTSFEDNVDRFVNTAFQFNNTMIVDYNKQYRHGKQNARVEVKLVGEPLGENVLDNLKAQMEDYGLRKTDLIVRQADSGDKVDFTELQKSYSEIIDNKNEQIQQLNARIASLGVVDTMAMSDISRELGTVIDNVAAVSLSKHIDYTVQGVPLDTTIVCFIKPTDSLKSVDISKLKVWLAVRTKNNNVKVFTEK